MLKLVKWLEKNIGLNRRAQFLLGLFLSAGAVAGIYSIYGASAIADREIQSTVQIVSFNAKRDIFQSGSGTVIDTYGDILTNYHVLGDAIKNKDWSLAVCVTSDAKKIPDCDLLKAGLVGYSQPLDLALLRITQVKNENGKYVDLKEFLRERKVFLEHVKINRFATEDEGLVLSEPIMILGYPDAGGSSITVTRGIVSGFEQLRFEDVNLPWLVKTDAKVNPGNSGGGAYNSKDEYLGVPKAVAGGDGNIGYIVSIPVINYFLDKIVGSPTPQTGLLCVDLDRGFLGADGRCYCDPGHEWSDADRRCVSRPPPDSLGIVTTAD